MRNAPCHAEVFDSYVREAHRLPNLREGEIFKAFKVSRYEVDYNVQGFLQVSKLYFQDGSVYSKGGHIDKSAVTG